MTVQAEVIGTVETSVSAVPATVPPTENLPATVPPTEKPMLPAAHYVKRGKGQVLVQHFTNNLSAKDIKAALQAKGVKGKQLSKQTTAVLRGDKSMRDVVGMAYMQDLISRGQTFDKAEEGKNGTVVRMVKIGKSDDEILAEKQDELTAAKTQNAELLAKYEALEAKLNALLAKS